MSDKILLIEDDIALARATERILTEANFHTTVAYTAEDGVHSALSELFDLILLDIMIPNMGGWEVCKRLRETLDMPIIFLTALGSVENVVRGLEMGADDYLVKPVEPVELLARVKAHIRRMQKTTKSSPQLKFGDGALVIDMATREVLVAGKDASLTPREFELLSVLAINAGRVVVSADLARQAWGMDDETAVENTKTYIHYVRKKIEPNPAKPRWIQTVRGVGYRFADD